MPNATTDCTHSESTTKVIEDYPRATYVVRVGMKEKNTRTPTKDPWYDLRVPWECIFKLEERRGMLRMGGVHCVVGGGGGAEQITRLGPA